ncbi:hypothetical protein BKA57DRAFT_478420, partial [Linnemannia elongata]
MSTSLGLIGNLGCWCRSFAGAFALLALGDILHNLLDVHAATLPGRLSALVAFNGEAHCCSSVCVCVCVCVGVKG